MLFGVWVYGIMGVEKGGSMGLFDFLFKGKKKGNDKQEMDDLELDEMMDYFDELDEEEKEEDEEF